MFHSARSALGDRHIRLAVAVVLLGVGTGLALPSVVDATSPPPAAAAHGHPAGPAPEDFLPIAAAPVRAVPGPGPAASTGTFTSDCGRNLDGHRNSDNFLVTPGVAGAAHHLHDYVGNTSTDGDSADASLAAAATTCARDDRSTYFWPVLRDIRSPVRDGPGRVLTPVAVSVTFRGNPQGPVAAMPRFLRVSVGDAKAVTHGPQDAGGRIRWTCSGAGERAMTTHYPLCPVGRLVERIAAYPGCWDGAATDRPEYRPHVVFGDPDTGACPAGTDAVPQLRVTVSYQVPPGRSYAIDSFPDQLRKPVADHFDFENVMPPALMRQVVECINAGRDC